MTTTPQPTEVYAGDQNPERLSYHCGQIAIAALRSVLETTSLFPKTREQVEAALSLKGVKNRDSGRAKAKRENVSPEATVALIAALIVAESDFNAQTDAGFPPDDQAAFEKDHEVLRNALEATGRRLVNNGVRRGWVAIDIWVVALDETNYWKLPPEWADKVERVEGVYFFDRTTITHCCSIAGSYWLEHLEDRVVFKPEVEEELGDEFDALNDEAWQYVTGAAKDDSSNYFGEGDIERLLKRNEKGRVYHYGNPGFDLTEAEGDDWDAKHRNVLEAVRENLQGNSVI